MDLSIIVPTLNEGRYIERTLDLISQQKSGELSIEIILVDAGSSDDTVFKARSRVDRIEVEDRLKGKKYESLNMGGRLAKGKMFLFLDADSSVPKNFDLLIHKALSGPSVVGGAFEFKMDGKGPIYRIIEVINRLRYRLDYKYFGDQGVFCSKEIFNRVGGYPSQPIMEAAYFCRELRRHGRLTLVASHLLTSARRFRNGNVLKVLAMDAWIWIQFTIGLPIRRYALAYWRENEKRN